MYQSDPISELNFFGVDCKNREIFLHNHCSENEENPGVDYRMASAFYKNIRFLDNINNDPIIIHMHSIGGCWNDGMTIFDSIRACKSYITIIAYGQAESMSSIILQAADMRVMMPNAYFMCHFGSSHIGGNFLDTQKAFEYEKRMADKMLDIYAERALPGKYFSEHYKNPSKEKVKEFLKRKFREGDWYLDAEESVYYGFADKVLGVENLSNINGLK
jgi:ATP-dependent protease ClpP protease subunit